MDRSGTPSAQTTTQRAVQLLRQQADAAAANCVRAVLRGDNDRALAYAKQHEQFLARCAELVKKSVR